MMVLPVYLPQNIKENVDLSKYLGIDNDFFTKGLMGKYFKKFNELFTRTEEDENRRYLCSSFLANYMFKQSGSVVYKDRELKYKFEGIIYPSARIGEGKIRFSNIVIPPSVVNDKMETNVPNIYACGDCTGGILQISKAVYQGTVAGLEIIKKIKNSRD